MSIIQQKTLVERVTEAGDLHQKNSGLTLKSTLIVGELERQRAAAWFGMSSAAFAQKIGLSESQYWKRAQAARTMHFFPESKAMVERGETSISGLAMIAARITQANADFLLAGIKGKSKQEIKALLALVTLDGRMLNSVPTHEFKIVLTQSQMDKLVRAREVLAVACEIPAIELIFEKALDELLWRRDPSQKTENVKRKSDPSFPAPAQEIYIL